MGSYAARIFLRYLGMYLVARGYLTEGDGSMLSSDPDLAVLLETGFGFAFGALAECWYAVERWLKSRRPDLDTDPMDGIQ